MSRRCTDIINPTLINLLFKTECVLCGTKFHPCNSSMELISVGCAFNHSFCKACLSMHANHQLLQEGISPRCPRYAECRFVYDENAFRVSLTDCLDMGSKLLQWHNILLQTAEGAHPMSKACPSPDCKGFVHLPMDMNAGDDTAVCARCSICMTACCWKCSETFHDSYTCEEVKQKKDCWYKFLGQFIGEQPVENEGGLRGGYSSGLKLNEAALDAFRSYESALADSEYFRRLRDEGSLKKCPKCKKLIEKLAGCDSMVCGQNADGGNTQSGCGHHFRWSKLPLLSVADVPAPEQNSIELNLHDPQMDYTTSPYSAIQCCQCDENIFGTRFVCIYCNGRNGICLRCLRTLLEGTDRCSNVRGHVYDLVTPVVHPICSHVKSLPETVLNQHNETEIMSNVSEIIECLSPAYSDDDITVVIGEIVRCGGVQKVIGLLRSIISSFSAKAPSSPSVQILQALTYLLHYISTDESVQETIIDNVCFDVLVDIIKMTTDTQTLRNVVSVVSHFSQDHEIVAFESLGMLKHLVMSLKKSADESSFLYMVSACVYVVTFLVPILPQFTTLILYRMNIHVQVGFLSRAVT